MRLEDINGIGGAIIEEALRAASVLVGYWLVSVTLVRLIDVWGPALWVNYVVPFVVSGWNWGAYVVFGVSPVLLGILGFVIYRPRNSWARWAFAPMGMIVWLAALWCI
ncbi:MAG: hypothetical protein ACFE0K_01760 [Alcanivorax sp.]|uniref:hypothetical protein n=1 Tax=Alcanivorax sp. TaxID=1872427 RepID=UPI003DA73A04